MVRRLRPRLGWLHGRSVEWPLPADLLRGRDAPAPRRVLGQLAPCGPDSGCPQAVARPRGRRRVPCRQRLRLPDALGDLGARHLRPGRGPLPGGGGEPRGRADADADQARRRRGPGGLPAAGGDGRVVLIRRAHHARAGPGRRAARGLLPALLRRLRGQGRDRPGADLASARLRAIDRRKRRPARRRRPQPGLLRHAADLVRPAR